MDEVIESLLNSIRQSQARLDEELSRNEAWRALQQLDAREAGGQPVSAIDTVRLRARLTAELAGNRHFIARAKLDQALKLLTGESAEAAVSEVVPSGAEAAIAAGVVGIQLAPDLTADRETARAERVIAAATAAQAAVTALSGAFSAPPNQPVVAAVFSPEDAVLVEVVPPDEQTSAAEITAEAEQTAEATRHTETGSEQQSIGDAQRAAEGSKSAVEMALADEPAALAAASADVASADLAQVKAVIVAAEAVPEPMEAKPAKAATEDTVTPAALAAAIVAPVVIAAGLVPKPRPPRPATPPVALAGRKPIEVVVGHGDLQQVQGIDRPTAARLMALGVMSHEDIAGWTRDDVERVGPAVGGSWRIAREGWIEQASMLQRGQATSYLRRRVSGQLPSLVPVSAAVPNAALNAEPDAFMPDATFADEFSDEAWAGAPVGSAAAQETIAAEDTATATGLIEVEIAEVEATETEAVETEAVETETVETETIEAKTADISDALAIGSVVAGVTTGLVALAQGENRQDEIDPRTSDPLDIDADSGVSEAALVTAVAENNATELAQELEPAETSADEKAETAPLDATAARADLIPSPSKAEEDVPSRSDRASENIFAPRRRDAQAAAAALVAAAMAKRSGGEKPAVGTAIVEHSPDAKSAEEAAAAPDAMPAARPRFVFKPAAQSASVAENSAPEPSIAEEFAPEGIESSPIELATSAVAERIAAVVGDAPATAEQAATETAEATSTAAAIPSQQEGAKPELPPGTVAGPEEITDVARVARSAAEAATRETVRRVVIEEDVVGTVEPLLRSAAATRPRLPAAPGNRRSVSAELRPVGQGVEASVSIVRHNDEMEPEGTGIDAVGSGEMGSPNSIRQPVTASKAGLARQQARTPFQSGEPAVEKNKAPPSVSRDTLVRRFMRALKGDDD